VWCGFWLFWLFDRLGYIERWILAILAFLPDYFGFLISIYSKFYYSIFRKSVCIFRFESISAIAEVVTFKFLRICNKFSRNSYLMRVLAVSKWLQRASLSDSLRDKKKTTRRMNSGKRL